MLDSRLGIFRVIAKSYKRIFAVGDVHGNLRELTILLNFVQSREDLTKEDLVVFVGDYIDRGPSSAGVVEYVTAFREAHPETICLQGNHEEMLLSFLGFGGSHGEYYLKNGGAECLQSYGVDVLSQDRGDIARSIPEKHLEFFRTLEIGIVVGNYVFVHAGIRPGIPLDEQREGDLRWIRQEFIQSPHDLGKTVVFGHTSFSQVFVDLPFKLGIDTGIAYGNALSIVEVTEGSCYQIELGEDMPSVLKI